jgi:hypothetical protein
MNNIAIKLYILLALVSISASADPEQKAVEVPQIENMVVGDAFEKLQGIGLVPKFQECFSSSTEKYRIIPGSQDPPAQMNYLTGKEVRAVVSLGPFPYVVGYRENEAEDQLDKANLKIDPQYYRNNSVKEGYVFDQEPKGAICLRPDLKVKIFINKPLTIQIESPEENDNVSSFFAVTGKVSSDLMENESLWIAVKPLKDTKNWWPQSNPPKVEPISKEFQGVAFLGGQKGDEFEIGILVVDNETNKKFMDWLNTSISEDKWPSITVGRPGTDQKVAKEIIEAHKFANVVVTLNQSINQ